MPLYEYFCDDCGVGFEALILRSASEHDSQVCPGCGGASRRILSSVNFSTRQQPHLQSRSRDGKPDVTSLTLPPPARLCWMDDRSAARLAAYKAGRGAEYDDTVAARNELARQHGKSESDEVARSGHSHSPLSDPQILANRAKAAQKEKIAESAAITKNPDVKP